MKKLILLLLFSVASLLCEKQYIVSTYKNIDESICKTYPSLPLMFMCAVLSAKYINYRYKGSKMGDVVIFKAYNRDCSIVIKLNEKMRKCDVEFKACDESFNYDNFEKVMDSIFLYN